MVSKVVSGISRDEFLEELGKYKNNKDITIVDIMRPKDKTYEDKWALVTYKKNGRSEDMFYTLKEDYRIDSKEEIKLGSKKERLVGFIVSVHYDRIFSEFSGQVTPGEEIVKSGEEEIEFDKLVKLSYCGDKKKLKIATAKNLSEPFKIKEIHKIVMKRKTETLVPVSKKDFLKLLEDHGDLFISEDALQSTYTSLPLQ